MPFVKGDPLARLAGSKGVRRRWAHATPEERAAAARLMNEGRREQYMARARAELGPDPSERDLARTAQALWQADLADRRLIAWQKRREVARP